MSESRIDKILDILDQPTQQPADVAYGSSPPDECWRCGVAIGEPERDLGACVKCVVYLRGEGDDPKSDSTVLFERSAEHVEPLDRSDRMLHGRRVYMVCNPRWSDPASNPLQDVQDYVARWTPIVGVVDVELIGDSIEGFDDDSFTPLADPPTYHGIFDQWSLDWRAWWDILSGGEVAERRDTRRGDPLG